MNMFSFLKKKPIVLYSPVNGEVMDLKDVPDQVFASKMMGDGVAFKLSEGIVYSPCDGVLQVVANTLHAYGFKSNNGAEILIHVGLDTVNLNGEGFELLVKQGTKVSAGDPIAKVDIEFIQSKGINLITPMVITNGDQFKFKLLKCESTDVKKETKVIEFI